MGFVGTVLVGIVGALVGWALFTYVLGIGDNDKFDLGGIIGAIVGTMLVLLVLRAVRGRSKHARAHRAPLTRAARRRRAAGWYRTAAAASWRFLVIVAAAGALVYALVYLRVVVLPIIIALLVSTLLLPVVRWLKSRARRTRSPPRARCSARSC